MPLCFFIGRHVTACECQCISPCMMMKKKKKRECLCAFGSSFFFFLSYVFFVQEFSPLSLCVLVIHKADKTTAKDREEKQKRRRETK